MHRAFHIAGWGYVAVCTTLVLKTGRAGTVIPAATTAATATSGVPATLGGGESEPAAWFRRIKPYCNSVEIDVVQRQAPAPEGTEGQGFRAACLALAGRIDDARRVIDALPADQRAGAANVVFNVGHPVADAGDDRSAGPIMELVVDYWPNHYMALYHAGMSEYMLGQYALAQHNLEAFLRYYDVNDGWRSNALEVLARLRDPNGRGSEDRRRPREPGS